MSSRWSISLLVITIVAAGCAPSRRSKTAGSIGCPPEEVGISSVDSSLGWGSSSETWVASCRGRRFICSENTVEAGNSHGAAGISQNLACTEELEGPSEQPAKPAQPAQSDPSGQSGQSAQSDPSEALPETTKPKSAPPKAAAGFEFGATSAEAQAACEGAGKSWTSNGTKSFDCSAPVVDVGFEATVHIEFCSDKCCSITVVHQPTENWIATFAEIKKKLSERYGPHGWNTDTIPDSCRKEPEFVQCIEAGQLRVSYNWSWLTKQKLELSVGTPTKGEGPAAIRIKYTNPQIRVRGEAQGL